MKNFIVACAILVLPGFRPVVDYNILVLEHVTITVILPGESPVVDCNSHDNITVGRPRYSAGRKPGSGLQQTQMLARFMT